MSRNSEREKQGQEGEQDREIAKGEGKDGEDKIESNKTKYSASVPRQEKDGGHAHFHVHSGKASRHRDRESRHRRKRDGDSDCGQRSFCHCKDRTRRTHPELCKATVQQCERSFCNPLCLRMAWEPKIWADCSRVPSWKGCPLFAEELSDAAEAITAQFRAYVCSAELTCCGVAGAADMSVVRDGNGRQQVREESAGRRLLDWVENKVFGEHYPDSKLPVRSCKEAPREARPASCALCQEVVMTEIDIAPERCLPRKGSLADVTPLSLHERCLFLADRISSRQEVLEHMLRKQVCACAGCCPGQCFFRLKEPDDWLGDMVEELSSQLLAQGPNYDHLYFKGNASGTATEGNTTENGFEEL